MSAWPSVHLTAKPRQRLFHLIFESHDGRCYGAAARILHSIVADVNRWSSGGVQSGSNMLSMMSLISRSRSSLRGMSAVRSSVAYAASKILRARSSMTHAHPTVEIVWTTPGRNVAHAQFNRHRRNIVSV
jgi:hypothetical protein